jgi:site-specific recombinase XerD
VRELLGHPTIATTERHTAVDGDEIRAAMMSAQRWNRNSGCALRAGQLGNT